MDDKKRRSPFEEHIESELFDVSELERVRAPSLPHPLVKLALDTLPPSIDHRVYDQLLSVRQRELCDHLAHQLVQQLLRGEYSEELQALNDDELLYIMKISLATAMVSQGYLVDAQQTDQALQAQEITPRERLSDWAAVLWERILGAFRVIAERLRSLFRRPY
jgi:hypothetical protein